MVVEGTRRGVIEVAGRGHQAGLLEGGLGGLEQLARQRLARMHPRGWRLAGAGPVGKGVVERLVCVGEGIAERERCGRREDGLDHRVEAVGEVLRLGHAVVLHRLQHRGEHRPQRVGGAQQQAVVGAAGGLQAPGVATLGAAHQEDVGQAGVGHAVGTAGVLEHQQVRVAARQRLHRLGRHLVAGDLRQLVERQRQAARQPAVERLGDARLVLPGIGRRADGEGDDTGTAQRLEALRAGAAAQPGHRRVELGDGVVGAQAQHARREPGAPRGGFVDRELQQVLAFVPAELPAVAGRARYQVAADRALQVVELAAHAMQVDRALRVVVGQQRAPEPGPAAGHQPRDQRLALGPDGVVSVVHRIGRHAP